MRHLVLVLGDQLDARSAAFDGFDRKRDAVWMAEVADESTRTWSTKPRTAMFLAGMRHFAHSIEHTHRVLYKRLGDRDARDATGGDGTAKRSGGARAPIAPISLEGRPGSKTSVGSSAESDTLAGALARSLAEHRPERVIVVHPGEWGVLAAIQDTVSAAEIALDVRADRHFICSTEEFAAHADDGRKQLRMEYFYRELRTRTGILMQKNGKPIGGEWNYDEENRKSFGKDGPGMITPPATFEPDEITRGVLEDVETHFKSHAGSLKQFDFPVTRAQSLQALREFIDYRLPAFGAYQDAMWTGEPLLYHSRLSAAMNLKLLDPREVIEAAEAAYRAKRVPLASAEGFIRQILGWREYVRGVYWRFMPAYLDRNALEAKHSLPQFYWDARTDMRCLREAISQTLELGHAHHIQRLMVTGLFALLLGVHPKEVHAWYLAVYVDAVEWVELPNTLGMSQFGDGSVMGSKPYVASGKYISRMSNYCASCRFNPVKSTGQDACPFTTLYWDFLIRHERALQSNMRMRMQLKNLTRLSATDKREIRHQADTLKERLK